MALFKAKQKEFAIEDLNSSVLKKVMDFNAKKGHLSADLAKNQENVRTLKLKLDEARSQYFDSFNEEILKEIPAIESELTALENVVKAQKDILAKGDKREFVLSKEESESLTETFAPIRKNRDDLVEKLHKQLDDISLTISELGEEQNAVHSAWSKVFGPLMGASQENWGPGVSLNKQTRTVEAQNRLNVLAQSEGLRVHLWHI